MGIKQKAEEKKMSMSKNIARLAVTAGLTAALSFSGVMAPVTMLSPYTDLIERLIPDPMFQVSVVHILFKVVAAAILLPCTNLVVKLTYKLIPKQKHEDAARLEFIDVNLVGNPSVSLLQIRSEVDRMAKLVEENLSLAMEGILA